MFRIGQIGFVHDQQYTLQDDWNEEVVYQKLCHVAKKDDKPIEGNAKCGTHNVNALFGKKTDFVLIVRLIEETIQSNDNVWNPWIGNGNSGIDAVSQANDIDETQMSKDHRKQPKKRTWTIETTWTLIQEMDERTQWKENVIRDDTTGLHEFRDRSSVTRTQMCSLKFPTAESWSNGYRNGPAAPFKTMWTQYGSFGKLEVSDNLRSLVENYMIGRWGFVVNEVR